MISWPEELVKDIARRKSVIFLGSGISCNSQNRQGRRPKTWREFLDNAAASQNPNKHIKSLIKKEDFLTACEIIKKKCGSDFNRLLRAEFLDPGYIPAPIHKAIFKLDSRIVATPNFDKIYETFANNEMDSSIIVKNHFDPDVAEIIRTDARLILKIHGTIDSASRMIFTRKEYAQARSNYQNFYLILEALAINHTFLFLGCGVQDPDIKLLMEDTFFRHPSQQSHIMVLPRGRTHRDIIDVIQDTMNLRVLSYNSRNNHQELLDSVQGLVSLVEQAREDLKETGNW